RAATASAATRKRRNAWSANSGPSAAGARGSTSWHRGWTRTAATCANSCWRRSQEPDGPSLHGPFLTRHDALHETVEHRHGERGITVAGAPHHALGNEMVAGRAQAGHLASQQRGNVPGTVRPRAKLRHRT